jgi:hypothetical protein
MINIKIKKKNQQKKKIYKSRSVDVDSDNNIVGKKNQKGFKIRNEKIIDFK